MGFGDQVRQWTVEVPTRIDAVFHTVVDESYRSITDGSEITGAPGQPVQSGELLASWEKQYTDENTAHISTDSPYGPAIEDGVGPHGPLTLRSRVGGFHSLKLTIAGAPRIVDQAAAKVVK